MYYITKNNQGSLYHKVFEGVIGHVQQKVVLNICHPNCSRIVSSFTMTSKLLKGPIILNQMRFF